MSQQVQVLLTVELPKVTHCPDQVIIKRLLQGHIKGSVAEALNEHLRSCTKCGEKAMLLKR